MAPQSSRWTVEDMIRRVSVFMNNQLFLYRGFARSQG